MDFSEKVVLVTGASSGIGAATAELLAGRGARLALVARDEARLGAVAERCARATSLARTPLIIVADLATDDGVNATVKRTLDHYGKLDVLVNSAGGTGRASIQNADMETFDRVFNINVRAVYNLTGQLVPALIKSRGNIVNVSSISGTAVALGALPYVMSKAALDHFTRTAALDLAPKGVRVNTVSAGLTDTRFTQRATGFTDEVYKNWLENFANFIPMGRVNKAADVAQMIVHLASDASAMVTGAVVPVDGGLRFVVGSAWSVAGSYSVSSAK